MKKYTPIILLALVALFAGTPISAQKERKQKKEKVKPWKPDSLEQAFIEGKYFMATFIRLEPDNHAFIYVSNEYADTSIADPAVRNMFLNTMLLSPDTNESFYRRIIASLPKEDLRIHGMIWAMDEFKREGPNAEGLYMLATWLVAKPTFDDPYYYVEARRNYYDRFGISIPMGYMRIHAESFQIEVMDISEAEYLPLGAWRIKEAGK